MKNDRSVFDTEPWPEDDTLDSLREVQQYLAELDYEVSRLTIYIATRGGALQTERGMSTFRPYWETLEVRRWVAHCRPDLRSNVPLQQLCSIALYGTGGIR